MNSTRAAFVLALLAACSAPRASSSRAPDVFWPTEASQVHHERAQQRWIRHASEREQPAARGYEEVLEELALARAGDRRIALYPGLAGRVHLDAADVAALAGNERELARHLEAARADFREARDLSEDWIPAHLGLAQVARKDERWDDAEKHLKDAIEATGRALGPIDRDPTLRELIFGRPRPRRPDALSAYPTEAERRDLLADQLALSETWGYNQPEGAGYGLPAEGLSGTQLLRRFRDRIGLERAYLRLARELASGTDRRSAFSSFVATIERDVLAREGDLVEAYLARAEGRRELGDLDGAISDLSFLTANPLLRRNATLAQGLADVRARRDLDQAEEAAERWTEDPESDALRGALDHLDSFFSRDTSDPDRLARATLLYVDLMAGYAQRNPERASEARTYARQRIELTLGKLPREHPHWAALTEAHDRLGESR